VFAPRLAGNPGTITIFQHQLNKIKQHTRSQSLGYPISVFNNNSTLKLQTMLDEGDARTLLETPVGFVSSLLDVRVTCECGRVCGISVSLSVVIAGGSVERLGEVGDIQDGGSGAGN